MQADLSFCWFGLKIPLDFYQEHDILVRILVYAYNVDLCIFKKGSVRTLENSNISRSVTHRFTAGIQGSRISGKHNGLIALV